MVEREEKVKPDVKVKKIWKHAIRARNASYSPYSKFKVGAAFNSGKTIYSCCNIENSSFGATLCAERVAIFKAIADKKFPGRDIVVVTAAEIPTPPCGMCLQVMSEFCDPKTKIWMASPTKIFGFKYFFQLLTTPFKAKNLKSF